MSRTETNLDKINHTVIPAAACLALLSAGSLSVYGEFDLVVPLIASISAVCILYLAIMIAARHTAPS
ncbi:hypothetical protein [Methanoregula boonei]|uniref:hypothetical protein n=1 Tax=Methanoregula boonei TaxID=358766 RepID=UPI0012FC6ACE|nr:hypothetical protein [Methanoregula boonei]